MVRKTDEKSWEQTIRQLTADSVEIDFIKKTLRERLNDLETAGALLGTMVCFNHCALACLDTGFDYVFVNQAYARACGRSIKELNGRNHFDLYPECESRGWFEKALKTGRPVFIEACPPDVWGPPEEEETFWNQSLLPVKNGHGEIEHLVLSFENVTRQMCHVRQIQQRLAEAEKMAVIGRLAINVVHEASSPLQTAMIILTRLQAARNRDECFPEDLALLQESFDSIHQTITGLLDLYRPSLVKRSRVCVNRTVRRVVEQLRVLFKRNRIEVNFDLSPDIPELETSPHQLIHCLLNICTNAMEAIAGEMAPDGAGGSWAGGQITIRTRPNRDGVEIDVIDTGPGFHPDKIELAFEPFYSEKQTGLGIGLTRCREMVGKEGGHITARNLSGGGAQVKLHLPISSPSGK